MHLGVGGGQYTALAAEALVPTLFVEMDILWVDVVVEARISDVDLVRRDTDDGSLKQLSAIRPREQQACTHHSGRATARSFWNTVRS